MAIETEYTDPETGETKPSSYWRLYRYGHDLFDNSIYYEMAAYASKELRDANKLPFRLERTKLVEEKYTKVLSDYRGGDKKIEEWLYADAKSAKSYLAKGKDV